MSKDAEHIIKLISKYFEPPCQYEYGDLDAYEFMNDIDPETGVEWCEENCGKISCYDCWVRFLNVLAETEKEQIEYGGEHIED